MKNFITRALSGIIYAALLFGALIAGKGWLAALLVLLSALGVYEYLRMNSDNMMPRLASVVDIAMSAALQLASCAYFTQHVEASRILGLLLVALLILRLVSQLYIVNTDTIASLQRSLSAIVYVALPLALVPLIYYQLATPYVVLALFIFIWMNDTGAYCVGCLIGRHKLFERISPKKTWEGFFGGMIFSVGAAFALRALFPDYFSQFDYLLLCLMGAVVTIFATLGDLIESMIKRSVGVKDSGKLIPGHGGILDRIDSLLLVIPAIVIYLVIIS
ncbi:MAG: phosphatidate cytidylyltransferase [Muribaculaceae bacterium]|nr:phosphatidate cytidylyltransferase [Muribaculaceae bacterium]